MDCGSHSQFNRWDNIPLIFEVYSQERLLDGDTYRSKPEIAAQMVREIKLWI